MITATLKESQLKPLTTINFMNVEPWITEHAGIVSTTTEITCI